MLFPSINKAAPDSTVPLIALSVAATSVAIGSQDGNKPMTTLELLSYFGKVLPEQPSTDKQTTMTTKNAADDKKPCAKTSARKSKKKS